jgi:hypothetical protein
MDKPIISYHEENQLKWMENLIEVVYVDPMFNSRYIPFLQKYKYNP